MYSPVNSPQPRSISLGLLPGSTKPAIIAKLGDGSSHPTISGSVGFVINTTKAIDDLPHNQRAQNLLLEREVGPSISLQV